MKHNRYAPLLMSLCVGAGLAVGSLLTRQTRRIAITAGGTSKLNYLMQLIDANYVDTVDADELVEEAMPHILSQLDPHSTYISARDAEAAVEDLRGSFSGIGVSFVVQRDTVCVINVIKGGPSQKVGIQPGDRILSADGTSLVNVQSDEVMRHLKGPKNTQVKVDVLRPATGKKLHFAITRADIPLPTLDAAYMLTGRIGYVKLKSFGDKTYEEFVVALAKLSRQGMKGLVVDLRGNRGGYMHIAVQMVNEFMPKGQLIVYTQGRKSPREDYRADGHGSFRDLPLVVIVDEASASASEIFAGAIQDNDRGIIIGRRTFGKGLVQQPLEFTDGSVVRLTIARYHTPSGRCIQTPYQAGHDDDYENELIERYERGEYFTADSIHTDGEAYQTLLLGREVYGGGGITPDIFVPEDTTDFTSYYRQAVYDGYVRQFTLAYADSHRRQLQTMAAMGQLESWLARQNILEEFAAYAEREGLKRRNLMMQKSRKLFERAIVGGIVYNIQETEDYQRYLNKSDKAVGQATELLEKGMARPTAQK